MKPAVVVGAKFYLNYSLRIARDVALPGASREVLRFWFMCITNWFGAGDCILQFLLAGIETSISGPLGLFPNVWFYLVSVAFTVGDAVMMSASSGFCTQLG